MDLKFKADDSGELSYRAYHGDVLNIADIVESESVDLVVTSPPYNIGKEYEDILASSDYLSFSDEWISEMDRIVSQSGTFWLNIGFYKESDDRQYIPWEYELYPRIKEKTSFSLVQQVIWHYKAGLNCKLRFSPKKETWLYYVKDLDDYVFNLDDVRVPHKYPNQSKNGELKVNPNGKNPGDVWDIPKVTSGKNRSSPERTDHPAQFPEDVIERIIQVSTNPGDLVVDPFLGSGTTMKVARDLGRSCIGVELHEGYLDDIVSSRVFDDYSPPNDISNSKQINLSDIS